MDLFELSPLVELANVEARGESGSQRDTVRSLTLARRLLRRSLELLTPEERRQQAELDRMIGHAEDKATLVEMTDQAFRTHSPERVADQLTHILDMQGVPRFFSPLDRSLLRGFQTFGGYLPGVSVPLVKDKMRKETANVILPAEPHLLRTHLNERWKEGVRMNVNFLGDSLLGEDDARRRLKKYLAAIQVPELECISVKVSTLYSQISALAREHTVGVLCDRMELLYRAAMREKFRSLDGTETGKFVYLDMEEYRDLRITVDVLKRTLDRKELQQVRAGVALQAYVPDSFPVLEELAQWSRQRVANGAAPLTVRIVKGANMEMERVEASIENWPQAPYLTKLETDANYKRMVRLALADENRDALRVGIASHNLFDISLAAIWAHDASAMQRVQFEMLEGMANHQRRALFDLTGSMLLYAPACEKKDFLNAIGYLIRRLDENTGEENFLRHSFKLEADSEDWHSLSNGFEQSLNAIDSVEATPRRKQNRQGTVRKPVVPAACDVPLHEPSRSSLLPALESVGGRNSNAQACSTEEASYATSDMQPDEPPRWLTGFVNEPNTDWSLPENGVWAQEILDTWRGRCNDQAKRIPLVVAGELAAGNRETVESTDPSRPGTVVARYQLATAEDVEAAVACAKEDPANWRSMACDARSAILSAAAQRLRERRGDLLGGALADSGKTLAEGDPEVSEAIDFAEFYALCAEELANNSHVEATPLGVVAVISPWNFPIAIPCGGVAAGLAAGNTVILKPASDAVLPAYLMCTAFWDAGVPQEALQLLPCRGSGPGQTLVNHPSVDMVVLTGGTETAETMLESRPRLRLSAETGGKNATVVTSLCDRDLAIKHVLQSAFGHSGQKCSATSLLLLEEEIYEDESFREALADAAKSMIVGSAWDLQTRVGPMVRPPGGDLARGLKELEKGESWLVMPETREDNPQLYRPGIKWDVQPDSFTHRTELFGPVLGVMKFRRLEEAIRIVNSTGFGLTSGLESLDDREQELWVKQIRAGNLYINRSTTGAVVLRQPFGGMGRSAFGPGIKAGGPNYVASLMRITDRPKQSQQEHSRSPAPDVTTEGTQPELAAMGRRLNSEEASTLLKSLGYGDHRAMVSRALDAIQQYSHASRTEYTRAHDSVRLVGQDNFRRYLPIQHLRFRISGADRPLDVVRVIAGSRAAGCRLTLSYAPSCRQDLIRLVECLTEDWAGTIETIEESAGELVVAIESGEVDRIRATEHTSLEPEVVTAANLANVYMCSEPVVSDGKLELSRYVSEQSISVDYHRYGNLGRRVTEPRRRVL